MASALIPQLGYEDDRFEQTVSQTLHCIICTNVIKDPVMCQRNEHLFCRACITIHLMGFHACPNCKEPLTVDTLTEAPRVVKELLDELKIRCDYRDFGCKEVVQLVDLERHVEKCIFASTVRSNEGYGPVVRKRDDLLQHETVECDHRTNQETEKKLHKTTEQLERMTGETSPETRSDQKPKKRNAEAFKICREPRLVITGGEGDEEILNSAKMFNPEYGTWVLLQSMNEYRCDASSVVHQNHFVVMGGITMNGATASVEKLSLHTVESDQSQPWENVDAELPGKLIGHCSVVYNGRLMVIGGFDQDKGAYANSITEISLVPPYSNQLLATMSQRRCYHGAALFGDKILIVGGKAGIRSNSILKSVVMYDITNNEFQELAPLPYPVCEMATVKKDYENVMIMGGVDRNTQPLNKVLMYNINTGQSRQLPNMKYKRRGCVAAVVTDGVIVIGGRDERGSNLQSVEKFKFAIGTDSWIELPEMPEKRSFATAVVY